MAAPIPTKEPTEMFLGDSLAWTKSLSDYPATTWTLAYRLLSQQNASAQTITASASGSDFSISVTSATSAAWTSGEFWLIGYVTSGTDRVQVYSGKMSIKPNPATATAYDGRTYLERVLALLQKTLEEGVIRDVIRYSIGGVTAEVQSMNDVLDAIDQITAAIIQEQAAASGKQRRILTRFTSPL